MSKGTIFVDVDDTILDWITAFEDFMKDMQRPKIFSRGTLEQRYQLPKEVISVYVEYFNDSHHFGKLPWIAGASTVINRWKDEGYKIHALSSCGDDIRQIERRGKQIKPLVHDMTLLPLWTNKSEWFREQDYRSVVLFVDDCQRQTSAVSKLNINTLHFTQNEYDCHATFKHWNELDEYSP